MRDCSTVCVSAWQMVLNDSFSNLEQEKFSEVIRPSASAVARWVMEAKLRQLCDRLTG